MVDSIVHDADFQGDWCRCHVLKLINEMLSKST